MEFTSSKGSIDQCSLEDLRAEFHEYLKRTWVGCPVDRDDEIRQTFLAFDIKGLSDYNYHSDKA